MTDAYCPESFWYTMWPQSWFKARTV